MPDLDFTDYAVLTFENYMALQYAPGGTEGKPIAVCGELRGLVYRLRLLGAGWVIRYDQNVSPPLQQYIRIVAITPTGDPLGRIDVPLCEYADMQPDGSWYLKNWNDVDKFLRVSNYKTTSSHDREKIQGLADVRDKFRTWKNQSWMHPREDVPGELGHLKPAMRELRTLACEAPSMSASQRKTIARLTTLFKDLADNSNSILHIHLMRQIVMELHGAVTGVDTMALEESERAININIEESDGADQLSTL